MRGGSVTERLDSNQKKSPQKPMTESKFKRLNRRARKRGEGVIAETSQGWKIGTDGKSRDYLRQVGVGCVEKKSRQAM